MLIGDAYLETEIANIVPVWIHRESTYNATNQCQDLGSSPSIHSQLFLVIHNFSHNHFLT